MKTKLNHLLVTALLLFSLSACTMQGTPTMDPAALGTIVAQNIQLTQMASTLTAVIAQQSATPEATNTPSYTPTSKSTATETTTPTPLSGVWLLLDSTTNCRSGPATYYPIVSTIEAGNQLQAIARSEDGEFFYVRYFDTSNHYCWLWKQTSYITGSPNAVPVYTAQPTATNQPTATSEANFTVSYNSVQSCSGKYSILITIKNTGNTTWQSVKVVVTDSTNSNTVTHTADSFTGYSGCSISQQQGDLTTNEPGLVSTYNPGEFSYDPTGHLLSISVSVYSEKGNGGTVVTKTFQVTP